MAKLPALTLLLLAPACTLYPYEPFLNPGPFELASVQGADGGRDVYLLQLQTAGGPHLEVRTEYTRTRAFLGLKLLELDKTAAERRGVQPYSGLLVTGAYPRSSAEVGGVLAGDVLLAIEGQQVADADQVAEVESRLRIGAAAKLDLLRGQTPTQLTLSVQALSEPVRDTQSVPLDAVAPQPYAGLDLYGIPEVWCERIYGAHRQAVVLANVEVGGPAWLAGCRSGDVVDAVDASPTPTVDELRQLIVDRAPERAPLVLQVSYGGRDQHAAELIPRPRQGTKEFWLPLVLHARDGVYQDEWSVGPFGLVLGNRSHYLADPSTRSVGTRNVFTAVFGLFRVESEPDDTCIRLFWFINLHV